MSSKKIQIEMIEPSSPTNDSDDELPYTGISMDDKFINSNVNSFIETSLEFNDYPKKLGYKTVYNIIYTTFFSKEGYYSSVFDIISSYIKAQKILYLEARSYCVFYLNCLMLPAIFLSSLASVLSLAIENYSYGGVILATVNAFNSFLLAVINYSKLDAASEAHKTSAHQYDKLQSMCEFTSGKILLLPGSLHLEEKKINLESDITLEEGEEDKFGPKEKLNYIENKIKEIKETNTFILPPEVIKRLPLTYHTNIFSKIKEFFKKEIITINQIKDLLNELRPLEYQVRILKNDDINILHKIESIRNTINTKTEILIKNSNENKQIEKDFFIEIRKLNSLSRCYRIFC